MLCQYEPTTLTCQAPLICLGTTSTNLFITGWKELCSVMRPLRSPDYYVWLSANNIFFSFFVEGTPKHDTQLAGLCVHDDNILQRNGLDPSCDSLNDKEMCMFLQGCQRRPHQICVKGWEPPCKYSNPTKVGWLLVNFHKQTLQAILAKSCHISVHQPMAKLPTNP